MNTIKQCFKIILNGKKEQSRQAARRVRKLLYSSAVSGKSDFKDIANLINTAPEEYKKILEDWRQENFVMAISVIYYLHDKEEQPDFLFTWLFELLQHKNGYIRHAAVRMFTNALGPLTVHIRVPEHKSDRLKPEQADAVLSSLHFKLNELLAVHRKPKYKKYKYINSLPTSPYKSIQMVLAELEDMCEIE